MDTVVINAITITFSDEGAGEPLVLPGGSGMTAGVGAVPRRAAAVWPGASFTEIKGMAHGNGGLRRGCYAGHGSRGPATSAVDSTNR